MLPVWLWSLKAFLVNFQFDSDYVLNFSFKVSRNLLVDSLLCHSMPVLFVDRSFFFQIQHRPEI